MKTISKTRAIRVLVFNWLLPGFFILTSCNSNKTSKNFEIVYEGRIEGCPEVYLYLNSIDRKIQGSYFDKEDPQKVIVNGESGRSSEVTLSEYDVSGNMIGKFSGKISDVSFVGQWSKPDGSGSKSFKFISTINNYDKLYENARSVLRMKTQEEEMIKHQAELKRQKTQEEEMIKYHAELNRNISNYLIVSNNKFTYREVGGVYNLTVSLKNSTKSTFERVVVKVNYLNKKGEVVNTSEVGFLNIGSQETQSKLLPDSNRGITVNYTIIEAKSSNLKYIYKYPTMVAF